MSYMLYACLGYATLSILDLLQMVMSQRFRSHKEETMIADYRLFREVPERLERSKLD